MAHVVSIYAGSPLKIVDGTVYVAQACGRQREDGLWEGWLEFVPDDGSVVLRSERETTQPNLPDLEYWASGLTPVYLQGALERTLTPRVAPAPAPVVPSVYDNPAPPSTSPVAEPPVEPVLNPFAVYAKGEELLRRQLGALSPRHLRSIAVGYELIDSAQVAQVELQAMTAVELIDLIVDAVSRRRAA
jgi:hypothetical protein